METLRVLFGALWLGSLLWIAGAAARSVFRRGEEPDAADMAVSVAVGYVAVVTVSLALALNGRFRPVLLAAGTPPLLALLALKAVRGRLAGEGRAAARFAVEEWRAAPALVKWTAVLFLGLALVKLLAPCTHGDAFSVYLSFPKFQSLSGRLWSDYPVHGNHASPSGHLAAALGFLANRVLAVSDFNTVLPRFLTGFLPMALVFFLLVRMARELFPARSNLLPGLLFLSMDAVATLALDGKTFLLSLYFEVLFLFLWVRSRETGRPGPFFLGALFLSFALSVLPQVYFNLPLLPLLVFPALWEARGDPRRLAKLFGGAALGLAAVFAYLYVYRFTGGNSFRSLGDLNVLPSLGALRSLHEQNTYFHGVKGFFTLPFAYSLYKEYIPATGANFGPAMLPFIAAGFFVWASKRTLVHGVLLVYFLGYYMEFFLFKQTARHALLALVGLSLPAAALLESFLDKGGRRGNFVLRASFCLIFGLMFLRDLQHSSWRKHFQFLLGREPIESFIARVHPTLYEFLPDGRLEAFLKRNLRTDEEFLVYGPLPYLLYFHRLPVQMTTPPVPDLTAYLEQNRVRYIVLSGEDPFLRDRLGWGPRVKELKAKHPPLAVGKYPVIDLSVAQMDR